MPLTAALDLVPNRWFDYALTKSIETRGGWVVIYVLAMRFTFHHLTGGPPLVVVPIPIQA